MFELFDLPNEKELAQIMLEGAKKAKSETNAVDTKTIFPFWEPPSSAKKNVVSPDKTGAVSRLQGNRHCNSMERLPRQAS